jgi:hypothetical protein
MIVTIHQPEHLPWTGFFHKMMCADLYVYLDHVQYKKGNVQNRNKIVNAQGEVVWATVPLRRKGSMKESIKEKKITGNDWIEKYLASIESSYRHTKYFEQYFTKFSLVIQKKHQTLVDINIDIINFFREELKIDTQVINSSDLDIVSNKSDMILDICLALKAQSYISGPSGLDYLDLDSFKNNNIEILTHQYTPPIYRSDCFQPGLSTLDLLFNEGDRSRDIIFNSGSI